MSIIPGPEKLRRAIESGVSRLRKNRPRIGQVRADVYERPDEFWVCVDAPGVEEDDIQVRAIDTDVLVRMDRFRPARDGFDLVVEGRAGGFDGKIPLPADASVDADGASATLRANGTLVIQLPKKSPVPNDTLPKAIDEE